MVKATIASKMKVSSSLDNALRQYRTEQAYIRAVPPASVFSNALLRRIVLSKPCTLSALSKLNGIGQTRRLHYGRDIVRLVNLNNQSKLGTKRKRIPKSPIHPPAAARGAKNTQRNALKGKTQANSRKTRASRPGCTIIPEKTAVDSLNSLNPFNPSNAPTVVSRFFQDKKASKLLLVKPTKTSVYVLELEDGRVYVGSSVDIPRRLAQHSSGCGSAYTKIYRPTGVLLPRLGNVEGDGDAAERDETLRYMMQRGIPFVRGWKFARVDMPAEEYEEAEANIRELFDLCRRCGYKGHFCTHCRANFDRMGNALGR
jgi:predicted GIY-YIG superfamily endonuclease